MLKWISFQLAIILYKSCQKKKSKYTRWIFLNQIKINYSSAQMLRQEISIIFQLWTIVIEQFFMNKSLKMKEKYSFFL